MGRPRKDDVAIIRQTDLTRYEGKVLILKGRIKRLERRFAFITKRCNDIYHNQNHYLRHRSKTVTKRQNALMAAALAVNRRLKKLPKLNVMMSSKKGKRLILLVTPGQARKLRALAELDFRSLLNSKANTQKKNRISLRDKGHNSYRRTE